MTRPATSAKVLVVPESRFGAREASAGTVPVRRYRLARVRFDGRRSTQGSGFDHIKRVYD